MSDYSGMRVTVMGLGQFGGGIGVTKWLVARGASVLVTDRDGEEKLRGPLTQIQTLIDAGKVRLRLGEHREEDFERTDLVVASAAVAKPWENRYLMAARNAAHRVTTEIALLLSNLRVERRGVIGVTGSVGKSTTTAMIHHALSSVYCGSRSVIMGGNIGGSLLERVDGLPRDSVVVLELSSAMLWWIDHFAEQIGAIGSWSPSVAVVTNIAPNHVDWHGSVEHYVESKKHIIRHQHPGDTCVLGENVWAWRAESAADAVKIDGERFPGVPSVPGAHNRVNAAGALLAASAAAPEVDPVLIARAIRGFTGLAHRLQEVRSDPRSGVRFFNDSKSTTPEATLTAVHALCGDSSGEAGMRRVHLIAGGYDKGVDLSSIGEMSGRLAGLYCIGATGAKIAASAKGGECLVYATLAEAMRAVAGRAKADECVLLSPGCASWDQYTNFEARGDEFVRLAMGGAEDGSGADSSDSERVTGVSK